MMRKYGRRERLLQFSALLFSPLFWQAENFSAKMAHFSFSPIYIGEEVSNASSYKKSPSLALSLPSFPSQFAREPKNCPFPFSQPDAIRRKKPIQGFQTPPQRESGLREEKAHLYLSFPLLFFVPFCLSRSWSGGRVET